MEPIPETREAIEQLDAFDDSDLHGYLTGAAELVRGIVPSCVGLTLAGVKDGVAFTLVATDSELATLDGVQYLDDGPCLTGAHQGTPTTYDATDPTDEARWSMFAAASAARGVASTLTLPIVHDGSVTGSVNLYASTPRAFEGRHEEVAAVFGAWPQGAVADADLQFRSRQAARETPQRLRDQVRISFAAGVLAVARDVSAEVASASIKDAAALAGVEAVEIAEVILQVRYGEG